MTVDKFTPITPELHRYAVEHSSFRDEPAREMEAAGEAMGDLALMQIAGDQAALITILVRATGARRALEVGTFLGYGAIAIARGLPEDGELICCELDPGYAERAREHLDRAGLGDRVEIRVGPAIETLRAIPEDGGFDFAFVDADKTGYPDYFEECLRLLRPNGLVMLDNTLYRGMVVEETAGAGNEHQAAGSGDGAGAMRSLNDSLASDERVEVVMLSMADGITLVRKR